jgi:hypothetical protein
MQVKKVISFMRFHADFFSPRSSVLDVLKCLCMRTASNEFISKECAGGIDSAVAILFA